MQPTDVGKIAAYLQCLYGERFQDLPDEMRVLWLKTLRPFPYDLMHLAVERWAVNHLPRHAPSLNDLATLAEEIQREQRQEARLQSVQQQSGDQGKDADMLVHERGDLLSDAELRAYLDKIYAHCDEQAARLAEQAESAEGAAEKINPPDPTRWLPLTENFSEDGRPAARDVSIGGWHKLVPARAPKPE